MVAAESPVLFAKACELFITDLTNRAWLETLQQKKKTMHKSDVGLAVSKADVYDFLADVINGVVAEEHVHLRASVAAAHSATSSTSTSPMAAPAPPPLPPLPPPSHAATATEAAAAAAGGAPQPGDDDDDDDL